MYYFSSNTIFEYVKNDFLLSNPKLVFFTEFNLTIGHLRLTIGYLKATVVHFRVSSVVFALCLLIEKNSL